MEQFKASLYQVTGKGNVTADLGGVQAVVEETRCRRTVGIQQQDAWIQWKRQATGRSCGHSYADLSQTR